MSTGTGGLIDLLHDSCSWLVAPTVDAWAQALSEVTAGAAADKGRKARAIYGAAYTPAIVTEQLMNVYNGVLDEHADVDGPNDGKSTP